MKETRFLWTAFSSWNFFCHAWIQVGVANLLSSCFSGSQCH